MIKLPIWLKRLFGIPLSVREILEQHKGPVLIAYRKENPMSQDTIAGIDVSHYEPKVDWAKVAEAGYKFSFAKASDGLSGTDPLFSSHRAGAKAAGLITGAYHFLRYNVDPVNQAHHFVAVTGGVQSGELPHVLDVEWSTVENITSIKGHEEHALKCLEEIERLTGVTPWIYTAFGFFGEAAHPERFAKYPLWVANYNVATPHMPKPWTHWTCWQHQEDAMVPGVGKSDVDKFNGSLDQLRALARK